ncbi:MAG: hypothetical protein ABI349_12365 [Casimicrobiaceae bacterium]
MLGSHRAILPAFGRFIGLGKIARASVERVVAIAGRDRFELPMS